ncbi:MAG TPA: hypothetical protein VKR59_10710, partial [Terriglobales bacterium]|nr:hypothetical protein [Terriglobales bacterium]
GGYKTIAFYHRNPEWFLQAQGFLRASVPPWWVQGFLGFSVRKKRAVKKSIVKKSMGHQSTL